MILRINFVLFGVLISAAAVCEMVAQSPAAAPPETIIRSETRLVLVDAVAMDKKGKFARDLTEKDFRVWEDGKEQKITSFSLESSGVSPERPSKHYIAMFFDTSTATQTGEMAARHEGIRFIDGFASPDRFMAVINYNYDGGVHIAQNFTTDADKLKKALVVVPGSSTSTPTQTTAAPARGGRGAPAPTATTSIDSFAYRDMLASLRAVVNSLAEIRGRKALVFFSGSMSVSGDLGADLAKTIEACNKANVAVYTVGPGPGGGLGGGATNGADSAGSPGRTPARAAQNLSTSDETIPRSLSEGTGGISFISTNDLAASLGKVAQEQDEYYLLGYTPTVDSAEGTCHELRVKVDRGDLDLRARKGYCTSKPVDLLSGKPAGKDLEMKAASGVAGNITARMQLPWFYSAPNVARVNLAMEINAAPIKFQKVKGKLHGEFDLAGVAYKPDGSVAARVSDSVKLDFETQQQVDAFLKVPYHYENQFDIAPGKYDFRMAFGAGTQGFGKVELPLKIDPWNGHDLAISALALSHDAHPAADLAAGLDVSLLEGLRPLVSKSTEVVAGGASDFHTGERGYFYFEAYEPLLAALTNAGPNTALPLLGVRIRVLDRKTGQQKDDSGVKSAGSFERAGNPVVPIVSVLPTTTLPAGAYQVEVSVMRPTGDPVLRTADFDVN